MTSLERFLSSLNKTSVQEQFAGETKLHQAVKNFKGDELIKALIKLKHLESPFLEDSNSKTPLYYAIKNKCEPEAIELLMEFKPDFNKEVNLTYLDFAFSVNSPVKTIEILLENGANPNFRHTETPFHFATRYKQPPEVFELLVKYHGDVNAVNNGSVLHWATFYDSNPKCVEILLKAGARIHDTTNVNLINALHYGVQRNFNIESAKVLAKYGQNMDSQDGNTCLHFFSDTKNPIKMLETLLELGANPNICNRKTPLEIIISKRNSREDSEDLIKLLLDYGADVFLPEEKPLIDNVTDDIKDIILGYSGICRDIISFLERQEFGDAKFKTSDGKEITIHSFIIKFRFEEDMNINNLIRLLESKTYSESMGILKSIYSGLGWKEEYENMLKDIGINTEKIAQKKGKKGLIKDLKILFNHEESKDFTIYVEEKYIKVHKLILIIRSDLYRGMFLNVQDDSNSVHDYSRNSFESVSALIYFFYMDEFPQNLTDLNIEELSEAHDYYELHGKNLDFYFEKFKKKKNSKKKKKKKKKKKNKNENENENLTKKNTRNCNIF
ncbi:ankyrin repeat-containing protein [Anaeramoeba ignava]|uniref:Ankyrin repeat-containing protein n=1 Tax=Anaeramoeba ignava TaxID=1746090 RepID=A0A9Q0L7V5_ANAIG|nr:ankyrin repeat-containing protein [Anaeramoeba ignava]